MRAIAKILHQEANPTKLASLAGIEETIRQRTLEHITPQLGFFVKETTGTEAGRQRTIKSIIGELPLTEKQAIRLELINHQRISPYLEQCCLRASANVSYDNAVRDIEYYTGIKISEKPNKELCIGRISPNPSVQTMLKKLVSMGEKSG